MAKTGKLKIRHSYAVRISKEMFKKSFIVLRPLPPIKDIKR